MRSPSETAATVRTAALVPALVAILIAALLLSLSLARPRETAQAVSAATGHIVVLAGVTGADGSFQVGGNDALNLAAARQLVTASGAAIQADLADQVGVLLVTATPEIAAALRTSGLVAEVARDFSWKAFSSYDEALASGELTLLDGAATPGGGPESSADPLEPLQWDMAQIRAAAGARAPGRAPAASTSAFSTPASTATMSTSSPTARARTSTAPAAELRLPRPWPGRRQPRPCVDNNFHGTHVAGTVAAQANGLGVVGVAPNVTLVPIKVCDADGHCYVSGVVEGITYAGDLGLDVINMSFFVDDDAFQESTEFKCSSDETQRPSARPSSARSKYARKQGVSPSPRSATPTRTWPTRSTRRQPIATSATSSRPSPPGVIGTVALGDKREKAGYSNWGFGEADVSAPGGNGTTGRLPTTILSTIPGGAYGCIQGTSMASPHAAGVAALIVSQFGKAGRQRRLVAVAPSRSRRSCSRGRRSTSACRATTSASATVGSTPCVPSRATLPPRATRRRRTVRSTPSSALAQLRPFTEAAATSGRRRRASTRSGRPPNGSPSRWTRVSASPSTRTVRPVMVVTWGWRTWVPR